VNQVYPKPSAQRLAVFAPEQLQGDPVAAQLAMHLGPVRDRPADECRRWSGAAEEANLEVVVVELGRERPAQAGRYAPFAVATDRGSGQPDRDPDLARAQALGEVEPQDFSDLAHGSTGTGHRHLLERGRIRAERAVSGVPHTGLAGGLSEGVANCRETGWPFPAMSESEATARLELCVVKANWRVRFEMRSRRHMSSQMERMSSESSGGSTTIGASPSHSARIKSAVHFCPVDTSARGLNDSSSRRNDISGRSVGVAE
jgi:hypothetical protein